jgi:hypothetical protein
MLVTNYLVIYLLPLDRKLFACHLRTRLEQESYRLADT